MLTNIIIPTTLNLNLTTNFLEKFSTILAKKNSAGTFKYTNKFHPINIHSHRGRTCGKFKNCISTMTRHKSNKN